MKTYVCVVLLGVAIRVNLGMSAAPPPEKLTPATFEEIKLRLTLTDNDLAWQRVHWRDGFFEGLLEAQAADKPLFYWIYEGDPRGYC